MIRIKTPSRVHMSLIDLNASIGRVDGGFGLALENPFIEVQAKKCNTLVVNGPYGERAADAAQRAIQAFDIDGGAQIDVGRAYQFHVGLGMGTQLMLAVGTAITKLYNLKVSVRKMAEVMSRGGTSGVGVAAFEKGGFILDGGHSTNEKREFLPSSASQAKPAPVLFRYPFPPWEIAIVIPKGVRVHGEREIGIFQRHCPIPIEEVRILSHLMLLKMLPALVEKDISAFGESINEVQKIGFKKTELELQTKSVRHLLKKCQRNSYGAGLSSFGPTIYCLVEDKEKLAESLQGDATLIFTQANNSGAQIY